MRRPRPSLPLAAYGNDERGVDVYLLSDRARAGAVKLDTLNPQTQTRLIG